ncbi:LysR family transcriptional regulator [Alginatibacterium sediminis]|uniref:LysR family transcriptional regulator n=1 Tax=Alginatibacterium sediminis TaxID=2164068 RepID=A0A420EBD6_9ALTE|nr:LysR substrate-binding domain-containing protein [Alginatibacterium sediminis]RKF17998.1 LysR family transcriptional regulator [Alginatibacterium sediminis]
MITRSDDLEMLLAVVDCGGFSAAAQSLDIQVAKISRAVSKIESKLGVSILNRTTRRVELSEDGRQFVDSIRRGIAQLELAENELISVGDVPKGLLRVDAASPFVFHQLVPLIQDFYAAYPNIELELTSNEGFVDLLEKRTDVAIRVGKLTDSSLNARKLGSSLLYMLASPDYLRANPSPKTCGDLANHQLIGFSGAKILNSWPIPGPHITPNIRASNGETVRQLALSGNGIACLSGFMVKQDIEQGRLVAVLEHEKQAHNDREQINAVFYKSSAVSKRISSFLDFIQVRLNL